LDRIVSRISERLDLTDAQQTQVKALLQAERSKVAPLLAEAAAIVSSYMNRRSAENLMKPRCAPSQPSRRRPWTELLVEKERVKSKIYNEVLTPEQKTKADQILERMHSHRWTDA